MSGRVVVGWRAVIWGEVDEAGTSQTASPPSATEAVERHEVRRMRDAAWCGPYRAQHVVRGSLRHHIIK